MKTQKLIPCVFIKNQHAVVSFSDNTVVETDPLRLVKFYENSNANEVIIFDLSKTDKEHEESIDLIHEICEEVFIPIIGAGNIERMEDVKKLLYAGCKKVCLNYSKESNLDITPEVSKKFGRDKLIAAIKDGNEFLFHKALLKEYVETLLFIDRHAYISDEFTDEDDFKCIIMLNKDVSLDKMLEYLKMDRVSGITGHVVNDNADQFYSLRELMVDSYKSFSEFKLNSDGMIPCIVQDFKTDEVLMLAYMNEESYKKTLITGRMTYFSRSRNELWTKGDTSGHYQFLKSLKYDCDSDTLLAKVEQIGAACHTGNRTCFFNDIVIDEFEEKNPLLVLNDVLSVIHDRKLHPKDGSYTNYLFDKGIDKVLKKVGEEATEIVIAAKNPNPNEIKYEISDFLYHVMVLMAMKNVTWEEIMTELSNR